VIEGANLIVTASSSCKGGLIDLGQEDVSLMTHSLLTHRG